MVGNGLHELARLYGVQAAYVGVDRLRHAARPEAILAVLKGMGAPVKGLDDVPQALRQRRQEIWQTVMRPVIVARQGADAGVKLRIPEPLAGGRYRCLLEVENAERREFGGRVRDLPVKGRRRVEGARYAIRQFALPGDLPSGYHRLSLELGGRVVTSMVLVAPRDAFGADLRGKPMWGAFLPLYALHRRSSWGAGDLGDLAALVHWVAQRGGRAVQVLPLLSELRELGDGPTPYEPATRLFWDEFYLDVTSLPHLDQCRQARALLERPGTKRELEALRKAPLADYASQMRLKRRVIETLADWYFAGPDRSGLDAYLLRQPLAQTYARFRAVGQRIGAHWDRWPGPLRGGRIRPGDCDPRAYQCFLYSLWQMEEQFHSLAGRARAQHMRLCLDLPLGVRRDGFDAWLHRDLFVPGTGVGAPPDEFFPGGQNWGFAPPDPQRQRQGLYSYWRACLRRHMECAGILRVDHIMGLHRLYWVPDGMEASEGVYVRYPADELFAILALESRRYETLIVGENLGTVPSAVNQAMRRHGVLSMYVVPFEVSAGRRPIRRAPSADCLACLNTHDMATFAASWQGLDIQERLNLGVAGAQQSRREREPRLQIRHALLAHLRSQGFAVGPHSRPAEVLEACLAWLGGSAAAIVMANLEDLWGEKRPQNVPGVGHGPNWRRKGRCSLETFTRLPGVRRILASLDHSRREAGQAATRGRDTDRGRTG